MVHTQVADGGGSLQILRELRIANKGWFSSLVCGVGMTTPHCKNKLVRKCIGLLVVLYGCETWSLTLREGHGLRVFGKRVLRRMFGSKRDEVTGSGENYIMRSFITCTFDETQLE
jgi:hypothetical protein